MPRYLKVQKGVESFAEFSNNLAYRYTLDRLWDMDKPILMCVGLNPSTADYTTDDPTVAKLQLLARVMGFGALRMTNLFAYRSTDPMNMKSRLAPIGLHNNELLIESAVLADMVLCCWGAHGSHMDRANDVIKLLVNIKPLHALSVTKAGQPGHPLYLPGNLRPFLWMQKDYEEGDRELVL